MHPAPTHLSHNKLCSSIQLLQERKYGKIICPFHHHYHHYHRHSAAHWDAYKTVLTLTTINFVFMLSPPDRRCSRSLSVGVFFFFAARMSKSGALHSGSGQHGPRARSVWRFPPHKTQSTNTYARNKAHCRLPWWAQTTGGDYIQPYARFQISSPKWRKRDKAAVYIPSRGGGCTGCWVIGNKTFKLLIKQLNYSH